MTKIAPIAKRFGRDRRGNFAIITALMAIPLFGITGLAVDYSRSVDAKRTLQDESDAIALAVAARGPESDSSELRSAMAGRANDDFNDADIAFSAAWISATDYQVSATTEMPLTLAGIIPGVGEGMEVATKAVARYRGAKYVYEAPESVTLEPEAYDYNRISAYCYDSESGRSQMTDIADNVGTRFDEAIPQCEAGETLSYRLLNVRNGKYNKNWREKLRHDSEVYEHFTDTEITENGEQFDLGGENLLETKICTSVADCDDGGNDISQPGDNHRVAGRFCRTGEYLYYGWEDRPNGDSDFDDIKMVVKCPEVKKVGDDLVTLIR